MKTASSNSPHAADSTRARLLGAAKAQFAQVGYQAASIRDLTQAARTNVASINYHFGDKHGLYVEVFQEIFADLRELRIQRINEAMDRPGITLDQLVEAFARAFFEPLVEREDGRYRMHLFMREMTDSRLPEGMVAEQLVGPITRRLVEAMRQLRPALTDRAARQCTLSLVGQLIQVTMVVPVGAAPPIHGGGPLTDLDLETAINHVVRFSTAGIEAVAATEGQP